jgi:hypothetical protein
MRKSIYIITFSTLFFLVPFLGNAQTDTSKIEQYCEVIAYGKMLSNKVTIDVDFGEMRSFWSDNRIKDETGKIKKFNSVIDAMNYMGKQGWKLTTALLIGNGPYTYHYVFRREINKEEVSSE